MPNPYRIESKVFLQGDRQDASGQLQGGQIALRAEGLITIAGTNAEKGQIMAAGKVFELTRCVGDAIDFME